MYFRGIGVTKDDVKAYAMLKIASTLGGDDSLVNDEAIKSTLTKAQLAEAEALVQKILKDLPKAPNDSYTLEMYYDGNVK